MAVQDTTCSITEYVTMHETVTLFNQTKAWKEAIPINQNCDEMKGDDEEKSRKTAENKICCFKHMYVPGQRAF